MGIIMGLGLKLLESRWFWLTLIVGGLAWSAYDWAYNRGYSERDIRAQKELADKTKKIDSLQADLDRANDDMASLKAAMVAQVRAQEQQSKVVVNHLQDRLQHWQDQLQKVKEASRGKLVTPKADSQCTLTAGFQWMLDLPTFDTTDGPTPGTPGNVDAPVPLKASEVAESVNANYQGCAANEHQLNLWLDWYAKWQEWLKGNSGAFDKP